MISAIDPLTHAIVKKALDGLMMRQTYIAQNIANASTDGYRPVTVSFEDALSAAADRGIHAVDALQPRGVEAPEGTPVRLDLELAEASQTALRYSGLIEIMGRQFALQRLIASSTGR